MERLDKELVHRGLIKTRSKAQELIADNSVSVNDKIQTKSSFVVKDEDKIEIVKTDIIKYVSRGGLKLEKSLRVFSVDLSGKVVLDIGSSTGGFTDCALQNGAKSVVAVDVGTNVMHEKLRNDPRVELFENTNIKDVPHEIFEKIDVVVVDVSFVSLERIVEKVASESVHVDMICLIKPQFECGKQVASKYNGVIKSKSVHKEVLNKVVKFFNKNNFYLIGLDFSPIKGGDGNIEYISHFSNSIVENVYFNIEEVVNIAFNINKEHK